jgi:hypothetical protein
MGGETIHPGAASARIMAPKVLDVQDLEARVFG